MGEVMLIRWSLLILLSCYRIFEIIVFIHIFQRFNFNFLCYSVEWEISLTKSQLIWQFNNFSKGGENLRYATDGAKGFQDAYEEYATDQSARFHRDREDPFSDTFYKIFSEVCLFFFHVLLIWCYFILLFCIE